MPRTEPVGPDTRFECIGCGDTMVNEYPESDATPDAFELERGECQPCCEYVRTDLPDEHPLANLMESNPRRKPMSKTTQNLAEDGWSSVNLEYNAYTRSFFEDEGIDIESVQKFLSLEVDGYRLVNLGPADDFDYALERKEPIDGSD